MNERRGEENEAFNFGFGPVLFLPVCFFHISFHAWEPDYKP
jgi:hypothetical protein